MTVKILHKDEYISVRVQMSATGKWIGQAIYKPGIASQGETLSELLDNLVDAAEAMAESETKDNGK